MIPKIRSPLQLTQVKALTPRGDRFHDQRGAIVWISKSHLQKIDEQLQLFERMKYRNLQGMNDLMKKNYTLFDKMKNRNIQAIEEFMKTILQ